MKFPPVFQTWMESIMFEYLPQILMNDYLDKFCVPLHNLDGENI